MIDCQAPQSKNMKKLHTANARMSSGVVKGRGRDTGADCAAGREDMLTLGEAFTLDGAKTRQHSGRSPETPLVFQDLPNGE
jgi:hypothetical protein